MIILLHGFTHCKLSAMVANVRFFGAILLVVAVYGQAKKGKCPALSDVEKECQINLPADECLMDEDCGGKKKCCTDGCTMRCITIKQKIQACSSAVDLAFIIDASTSIGEENLKMMQPLISKLVNSINIGENGTHVGVIHFANTAVLQFDFNRFKGAELSKKNVRDEINKISFTGGKSRIDLALKLAKDNLFNKEGGVRKKNPKVAIVLTDGNQSITSDLLDLRTSSRSLQDIGVHVYVVAVGRDYNILSLLDIASHDGSIYRYVKNYHSKSIVDSIVEKICKN